MSLGSTLSTEIDSYLQASGTSARQFGWDAMNDPTFVYRLRKGAGITSTTLDKVRAYIKKKRKEQANPKTNIEDMLG